MRTKDKILEQSEMPSVSVLLTPTREPAKSVRSGSSGETRKKIRRSKKIASVKTGAGVVTWQFFDLIDGDR